MGIQLAPAQNVYKHYMYLQGLQTTEVLYHMKYTDLGERVCRQGLFFVYVHAKAGQGK